MTQAEMRQNMHHNGFTELTETVPCCVWVKNEGHSPFLVAVFEQHGADFRLARIKKADLLSVFALLMLDYSEFSYTESQCVVLAKRRMEEVGLVNQCAKEVGRGRSCVR